MLCFAFCSHPPTLTPLQKNARGGGVLSIPSFLPSRASWFFHPFIHSFVPTFVHSFIRTFIRVLPPPLGIWPARADPPRSCLTLPAGLSPAPFPPRPPLQTNCGWLAGRGRDQGGALLPHYPRQRPRLRKRAAGLLGSGRRWRLRGVSCHAGPAWAAPAPLHRGLRVGRHGARVSVRATAGCAQGAGGCAGLG